MNTAKTFTTEDCLNAPQTECFSGLNVIALQKFDIPYEELSPSLKSYVREEAVRRAGPDMLAALKFVKEFFRKMEDHDLPGDPLIEIRRKYHAPVHAQLDAAIALAEGRA